jgi:hypothetical protein
MSATSSSWFRLLESLARWCWYSQMAVSWSNSCLPWWRCRSHLGLMSTKREQHWPFYPRTLCKQRAYSGQALLPRVGRRRNNTLRLSWPVITWTSPVSRVSTFWISTSSETTCIRWFAPSCFVMWWVYAGFTSNTILATVYSESQS